MTLARFDYDKRVGRHDRIMLPMNVPIRHLRRVLSERLARHPHTEIIFPTRKGIGQ